ncbi:MAG: hypothetical protein PHG85_07315 [Candidatus Altiarchaeota archaeon]|nr:hypothetical protein [Candidatus Altiarchaeota archaeon]
MNFAEVIKESLGIFLKNIAAYVAGGFIAIAGSIFIITLPPLFYGLYLMAAKGARGEKVEVTDVFSGFSFFARSWAYTIIIVLLAFIPAAALTLALAVPSVSVLGVVGVIPPIAAVLLYLLALMIMTVYAIPLMVIKNLGAKEGVMSSISLVKNNLGQTALLMLCLFAINIAVSLIPVIGMLLTRPFTAIVVTKAAMECREKEG